MSTAVADYAKDIAEAHEAATTAMRSAVLHAERAGNLLKQAKAVLPHGEFGAFCAKLPFGETTARGYMRLASHVAGLDATNRQRVAEMPLRAALLEIAQPRRWMPVAGHWHMYADDDAAWHVVPSLGYSGLFHISKLWSESGDDSFWTGTRFPIPATMVDQHLRGFGFRNPIAAAWQRFPRPGLAAPFGMPAPAAVRAGMSAAEDAIREGLLQEDEFAQVNEHHRQLADGAVEPS